MKLEIEGQFMDNKQIQKIKSELAGAQLSIFVYLEKLILLKDDACTGPISFQQIAEDTDLKIPTVQKSLQRLVTKKIIVKIDSKTGSGGWCNYVIPSLIFKPVVNGPISYAPEIQESVNIFNELASEAIILHKKGIIIYANPAYIRMFGHSLEQVIGVSSPDLVVAPDSRKTVKDVIRAGNKASYVINGIRKNGEIFPMEIESKLAIYHDEEVRVTLHRDISELMRAKKEIEVDRHRIERVLQSIPALVFVLDEDSKIIKANAMFNQYFSNWQGKKCWELIHGNKGRCPFCPEHQAQSDDRMSWKVHHSSGKIFQAYSTILPNADGKKIRLVMGVDITDSEVLAEKNQKNLKLLQEKHLMLKGLLAQIEQEKNQVRESISLNIGKNILPLIEKLKNAKLDGDTRSLLNAVEGELMQINDDFYGKLEGSQHNLTSAEFRICHLIKSGRPLQEIADLLSISENTMKGHCRHIRKKLGITDPKISLKVHLMKLEG